MADFVCPRCKGTDIYFAKRQEIKGLGGIYGQRARMVNTPLCRACGEVANRALSDSSLTKTLTYLLTTWKGAVIVISLVLILFYWFLSI